MPLEDAPNFLNCPVRTNVNDPQFLTVYYQNVRGIRTKTNELFLKLSACEYDIIVLTETWLRPDVPALSLPQITRYFAVIVVPLPATSNVVVVF